ncbi:uncharacterized protein LOC114970491 [Acropora millepora]|uniref:uncharacterized protein LOC114970491 n=1 Tax=Acropora millepora TaxID=45264 RepID=UPI001CF28573|nr:uncharacterized protein LOC114970491 [Acropora millepora]
MKRADIFLMTFVTIHFLMIMLQGCPVKFTVQITDFDNVFEENIDVDIKEDTETLHVPASDDLVEAYVIHNFKKKRTMNVLPAQGKCLYTKLDEDIPNPKKMIRNFNKNKYVCIESSDAEVKNITLMTRQQFRLRSKLPRAMKRACKNLKIYRAERQQTSDSSKRDNPVERACTGKVCKTWVTCIRTCHSGPRCQLCVKTRICEDLCQRKH